MSFDNFGSFLVWAGSGPGLIAVLAFVESYILERFSFWHKWDSDLRALLCIILAGLFAWGAQELSSFPALFSDKVLNGIFDAVVFYVASQVAYKKYFKRELSPK